MSLKEDFKKFAMRGNVIDMAVGVIIGGAFGKIVGSLVSDLIMPPIGMALGKMDFKNLYLENMQIILMLRCLKELMLLRETATLIQTK